jgi:hypothetical protein
MQQMIAAEATGSKLPDLGLGGHNDDLETTSGSHNNHKATVGSHNDDIAERLKPKETKEGDSGDANAAASDNDSGTNKTAAKKQDSANNIGNYYCCYM